MWWKDGVGACSVEVRVVTHLTVQQVYICSRYHRRVILGHIGSSFLSAAFIPSEI